MAKRPKAAQDDPPKTTAKGKRWGSPFHFWTNPAIRKAFDRFVDSHQFKPKDNDVLEQFLKKQLGDIGFWTTKDQELFDSLEKTRPKKGRPRKKG